VQDRVERRLGQRDYLGKAADEALEVRDHGLYLRLLQHDLRDQTRYGVESRCHGRSLRPPCSNQSRTRAAKAPGTALFTA